MRMIATIALSISTLFLAPACKKKDSEPNPNAGAFQLFDVKAGSLTLDLSDPSRNTEVPVDQPLVFNFSVGLDTGTFGSSVQLKDINGTIVAFSRSFQNENKTASIKPAEDLNYGETYSVVIGNTLRGSIGEIFPGTTITFGVTKGNVAIDSVTFDNRKADLSIRTLDVNFQPQIKFWFASPINAATWMQTNATLSGRSGPVPMSFVVAADKKSATMTPTSNLASLAKYTLNASNLKGAKGQLIPGLRLEFYTRLDTATDRFPRISDDELLTKVQRETFRYFWEGAHQASGMAYERGANGSPNVITTGGSGFGIMGIIVAVERGFVTRPEALQRWELMTNYLRKAQRFHGAWPHWFNANEGTVKPFSPNDNGGDLVETAFMTQGLMTVRQYLNRGDAREAKLVARIDSLLDGVEYDWYRRNNQNVLYWHWSPDKDWIMNFALRGYNETMITYVMAAASRTHTIPREVYQQGFTQNGGYQNGKTFYGYRLPLGFDYGGPLFFTHYSFLGLKPTNLHDMYASFQEQNVNHTLINYSYCVANPKRWASYGPSCWGLTASDNQDGYSAHEPNNDLGVITPTAALSSMPYAPQQSMAALRYFYYKLGDRIWGPQGFYDAFNPTAEWYGRSYLAIDQGPIIVMIENHRTGLLWNLFMSSPEVQQGLTKIGFTY